MDVGSRKQSPGCPKTWDPSFVTSSTGRHPSWPGKISTAKDMAREFCRMKKNGGRCKRRKIQNMDDGSFMMNMCTLTGFSYFIDDPWNTKHTQTKTHNFYWYDRKIHEFQTPKETASDTGPSQKRELQGTKGDDLRSHDFLRETPPPPPFWSWVFSMERLKWSCWRCRVNFTKCWRSEPGWLLDVFVLIR